MSLFSRLNKDALRNSVEKVKNKLTPETSPAEERDLSDQHIKAVSREIKILTARNIAEQIHEREQTDGKMTHVEIQEFATKRAMESGWKDERIHRDVAAMVTKLYHLGLNLPDSDL